MVLLIKNVLRSNAAANEISGMPLHNFLQVLYMPFWDFCIGRTSAGTYSEVFQGYWQGNAVLLLSAGFILLVNH